MNRKEVQAVQSGSRSWWRGLGLAALLVAVFVLSLQALLAVVRAEPSAPQAPAALVTVADDTAEDFYQGSFYHTGVSRRTPPEGDGNGELRLLAVGIAGTWYITETPPGLPPVQSHSLEIYKDTSGRERLYVIGGADAGRVPTTTIYTAPIITSTTPGVPDIPGPWTLAATMPYSVYDHQSVIVPGTNQDFLYVIGGIDATDNPTSSVIFAPINRADGSIGAFSTAAPLPAENYDCDGDGFADYQNYPSVGRAQMGVVQVNGTIYVIGGSPYSPSGTKCVFYATPDPNTGQITSWTGTENFPELVYGNTATVYDGTIYSIGGSDTSAAVYKITPNADGSLPASGWVAETNTQNNHHRSVAVTYNGQVLLVGGAINDRQTPQNTVNVALINQDGTLDTWITTEQLNYPRLFHDAVVSSRGWIYVVGGDVSTTGTPNITPHIEYGTMEGEGRQYAPWGEFVSRVFALDKERPLQELRWTTYITDTSKMTVTIEYRIANTPSALAAAPWQGPFNTDYSVNGLNTTTITLGAQTAQFFQYRIRMGTRITTATPIVQKVELVYEVTPPDLAVSKKTDVTSAGPGDLITYTITYESVLTDSAPATGVRITETIPPFVDYVSASPYNFSFVGTLADGSKQYAVTLPGELQGGVTGTLTFVTRVTTTISALPFNNPQITNTVEIGHDGTAGPDRAQANNKATIFTPLQVVTLQVIKENSPQGEVEPGDEIVYTLRYSNTSDYQATGVVIEDPIPANTTYVAGSATGPVDTSQLPAKLRWNIGTLAPHTGGVVSFKVRVRTDVEGIDGDFENQATIWGNETLPNPSNGVVNTLKTVEALEISKSATPAVVKAGDLITFTVRYTNTGNVDLSQVVITDPVPLHTDYLPGTITGPGADDSNPEVLVWNVGTVPIGSSGTVSFVVRAKKPLAAGTTAIQNVAFAQSKTIGPIQSSPAIVAVGSKPKFVITKRASPAYGIKPGDTITFTIAYTNVGSIGAQNVVITDRLPANTTLLDSGNATSTAGGVLRWEHSGELVGLGGSGSVQFTVRVDDVGAGGIANEEYRISSAEGIWATGKPVYVPVGADFVPVYLQATKQVLNPNDTFSILVGVTNQGGAPNVSNQNWGIWVDLYVKNSPTPPASPQETSNTNVYWYVFGNEIEGGTVKDLSSASGTGPGAATLTKLSGAGTYYVYAQVNTDDGSALYPVPEWPTTNNIIGPLVITVTNEVAPAPTVASVTPATSEPKEGVELTVAGSNFQSGAQVWLYHSGYGIRLDPESAQVANSSTIRATFDLRGQPSGQWDVVVRNPDGGTGTLPRGFSLQSCPPNCSIYLPVVSNKK